jgi:hypothetical protein
MAQAERVSGTLAHFLKTTEDAARLSGEAAAVEDEVSGGGTAEDVGARIVAPVQVPLDLSFKDLSDCAGIPTETCVIRTTWGTHHARTHYRVWGRGTPNTNASQRIADAQRIATHTPCALLPCFPAACPAQ